MKSRRRWDEAAVELWGITDKELEIGRSLEELG